MSWQWHPGLAAQFWGFSSPCGDVPSLVGSGVCGAGAGSRRTTGIVIFDASEWNVKVKALMVLPGWGAWGANLCPSTVANVALSLCQATLKPWLGTWAFHTAHRQNGWKEEKWREKGGWEEKARRGSVRGGGGQASGVTWAQTSGWSNEAMDVQCARYSSHPSRSGQASLISSPAHGRDAKDFPLNRQARHK